MAVENFNLEFFNLELWYKIIHFYNAFLLTAFISKKDYLL